MWWWLTTALAMGPGPAADAGGPSGRRARAFPLEEPLDLERLRETGDVPLLAELPTRGRLGPLRLRVGRQKTPFLASYLEDLRSVPMVQRPLSTTALDADRMVGGRAQWSRGPVALTAAAGHPDNLRGFAWDLQGRGEIHVGSLHLGAGTSRGQHRRFAPRVIVADRFRWFEAESKDALVQRSSADVSWNPAPLRLDVEAATLRAGKGRRPLQLQSAAAGLAVMLTGEHRPVGRRIQPKKSWDPARGQLGALELATRYEALQGLGQEQFRVDQLSLGLTSHPLVSVRLPLVWSRAWMGPRTEDRVMLRVAVDR